jgi:hypothetical protein
VQHQRKKRNGDKNDQKPWSIGGSHGLPGGIIVPNPPSICLVPLFQSADRCTRYDSLGSVGQRRQNGRILTA